MKEYCSTTRAIRQIVWRGILYFSHHISSVGIFSLICSIRSRSNRSFLFEKIFHRIFIVSFLLLSAASFAIRFILIFAILIFHNAASNYYLEVNNEAALWQFVQHLALIIDILYPRTTSTREYSAIFNKCFSFIILVWMCVRSSFIMLRVFFLLLSLALSFIVAAFSTLQKKLFFFSSSCSRLTASFFIYIIHLSF